MSGCDTEPDDLYKYSWAARQLNVTVRTIVAMVKSGRLGYLSVSPGGRRKRILPCHIAAYRRANEHKAKRGRKAKGATY